MKRSLWLLLVVVLLGVLAACQPATPQVVKETVVVTKEVEKVVTQEVVVTKEVEKPGKRTLVIASRLFSPPREQEFFINEILKPWEEENNVTVVFQIIDDKTLLERAQVQQQTGHVTTDLVIVFNAWMPTWIEKGWVEDLSDVVAQWDDRTFMEAFNQDMVKDGK